MDEFNINLQSFLKILEQNPEPNATLFYEILIKLWENEQYVSFHHGQVLICIDNIIRHAPDFNKNGDITGQHLEILKDGVRLLEKEIISTEEIDTYQRRFFDSGFSIWGRPLV